MQQQLAALTEELAGITLHAIATQVPAKQGQLRVLTHFARAVITLKLSTEAQQQVMSAYARVCQLITEEYQPCRQH